VNAFARRGAQQGAKINILDNLSLDTVAAGNAAPTDGSFLPSDVLICSNSIHPAVLRLFHGCQHQQLRLKCVFCGFLYRLAQESFGTRCLTKERPCQVASAPSV
jgi:hypothetical protein